MQVRVKNGNVYIPVSIWEKAHLSKDGKYEVEIIHNQIVIKAQSLVEPESRIKSVREFGVVGMWADRDDIDDSGEWLRKQRVSWSKRFKSGG